MHKGKNSLAGLQAIALHSGVHALGTLLICLIFAPALWWLFIVDFILHGSIDKAKSMALKTLNLKAQDTHFWWLFGLDQELHNLSHLAYILFIVSYTGL